MKDLGRSDMTHTTSLLKIQSKRICLSNLSAQHIILSIFIYLSFSSISYGQGQEPTLFEEHLTSLKQGMTVLGSWSVSNLVVGGIMRQRTQGTGHYFHEMNATWNLVNLGIAGIGYFGLPDITEWTAIDGLREFEKLDRILLFNAGLDLAYMALGYALIERGHRLDSDRFLGYGRSLILQGAFLFVFDSAFAYLHSDLTDQLRVSLLPSAQGISINMQF